MEELFTTKIAMCANKINIVNFDFTRTLTQKKNYDRNVTIVFLNVLGFFLSQITVVLC